MSNDDKSNVHGKEHELISRSLFLFAPSSDMRLSVIAVCRWIALHASRV